MRAPEADTAPHSAPTKIAWMDHAWLAIVALIACSHLLFALLDERVPVDSVFLFSAVPVVRDALAAGDPWRVVGLLTETGGWYNLLVVGTLEALGPSPAGVRAFGMVASSLLVAGAGLLGRRLGGPRSALAAAALAGATPMIVAWGRLVWFHIPEAALIVGLLALVHGDPRLQGRGAWPAAAALGAAALTLRETGLFWMASLAPALVRARGRRWWPVALAWLVAAWVPVSRLWPYLSNKLSARALYAERVAPLQEQLAFMIGWGVLALAGLGLAVALWRAAGALTGVLAGWVVAGFVLVALFRAGLDNHTLFAVGLTVLGGAGLARLRLHGLAVGLSLAFNLLAMVPAGSALAPLRDRAATLVAPQRSEGIDDYARPWREVTQEELRRLFAACPAPCAVLVHGGLFHPHSQSGGGTELWALGVEARLTPLGGLPPRALRAGQFGAAATHRCAGSPVGPPDALFEEIVARNQLKPTWERAVTRDCALVWYAR